MKPIGRRALRETLRAATLITALAGAVLGAAAAPAIRPEPTAAEKISAEEIAARRAALRAYFAGQRAKMKIVATTRTERGQVIDWVPRDSQSPGLKVATPPRPDDAPLWTAKGERLAPFELAQQPKARGPAGTVPILRRDAFVERIVPPPTVEDFLSKYGLLAAGGFEPPGGGPDHVYAWTEKTVGNIGGQGSFNVWDSYVHATNEINAVGGEFNLAQVAVKGHAAGVLQTVEAGWQNYPNRSGDGFPHFFTFFNTNGYTAFGNDVGGYDRDVTGWVQHSTTVFPGALLDFSAYMGDQVTIYVRVQLDDGKWWIRLNDEWVGYYPADLFGSPGLRDHGDGIAFYGEIVNQPDGGFPYTPTDMGSGEFASQGFGKAAYVRNIWYFDTAGTSHQYDPNPGDVWATDPTCYSIEGHFLAADPPHWQSHFYYGGPGYSYSCP
jgi:hypothetical protein